ncbi:hypothetical protein [Pseudomonas sp. R3-18-08]|uniref:hypothetical protein n=1 Tax=Pseudomonas sp. R3-18-08 TaxID=1173283 RepID=UPI000F584586|nr:hypothetical protein [Pseudomonas sp. R3-18-08]AZF13707.1 hypothetical protein C4J92_0190 [Pseudomonas sp. R3-18-08]
MDIEELLEDEYGDVIKKNSDMFFFQDETKTYVINYWLKAREDNSKLLVISQDFFDDALAEIIVNSVSVISSTDKPLILPITAGKHSSSLFTHIIILPQNYHGYMKSAGIDRGDLYWCIPIFRCEFSGEESVEEFMSMRVHFVPVLDWKRAIRPKVKVYFDNPKTGAGADETRVLVQYLTLLQEVDNLEGVSNGFIELENYKGEVVEILSPVKSEFILILNREDETAMSKDVLKTHLDEFVMS